MKILDHIEDRRKLLTVANRIEFSQVPDEPARQQVEGRFRLSVVILVKLPALGGGFKRRTSTN